MRSITRCRDEHRELEALCGQLQTIVSGERADPAAVAMVRWRMCRLLLDHLAVEDRVIGDRLLGCGDTRLMALAWRYRHDFGGLGREFRDYLGHWPIERIARDWDRLRAETEHLLWRLATRAEMEERELFPALEAMLRRRNAA